MSILTVINNMSNEEKIEIKDAVAYNKTKIKNGKYDAGALSFMFKKWKELFPKVKQSMSCKGCRDSVVKFFEQVVDIIEKEENENNKTLTGALSPTGPRA
tara:strand:+ start:273 stop:572 length:300 start_codon:yes stop_codon:yes gene_type:complete